jgi:DNA-binding response OmpR family regulator
MPHTILVVDDDRAMQELIADVLSEIGYDVQTATQGSAALFLVGEALPDLIVLDLAMPIMDGPTFARRLTGRGITTPILVITGAANGQVTADEIGAAAVLIKPFEPSEMRDAVYDLLSSTTQPGPKWEFR